MRKNNYTFNQLVELAYNAKYDYELNLEDHMTLEIDGKDYEFDSVSVSPMELSFYGDTCRAVYDINRIGFEPSAVLFDWEIN